MAFGTSLSSARKVSTVPPLRPLWHRLSLVLFDIAAEQAMPEGQARLGRLCSWQFFATNEAILHRRRSLLVGGWSGPPGPWSAVSK